MAFVHSKETRVLVNEAAASGGLRSISSENTRAMSDTTVFLDNGQRSTPGLKTGTLTLAGPFSVGALFDELKAAGGVDNSLLVTAGMAGMAAGSPVHIAVGDLANYGITSEVAEAVGFTVESTVDETVEFGVSLHDNTTEVTTSGESAPVDNAASSATGGVAALHVVATSGTTPTADIVIQHSADDITYADLVTFNQATAPTSHRVTVAGTVNRYLRVAWTLGGADPSFAFAVAFAR